MDRVLLVDDDPGVLFALSELLEAAGIDVVTASSGAEALGRLGDVAVVVTDLAMPGITGLELLGKVRALDAELPVILITAHGSERAAVAAMKQGAYDYITKPFDNDEVRYGIERALETRRLRQRSRQIGIEEAMGVRIVGKSPALAAAIATATRLADKDVTVLIRGETGTGKELFSSLLHARSRRAGQPLVRFNCAAIPHELAEAHLFGYTRGAFTGATASHPGYFAQAQGGTLVLDEIGELPLGVQAKLLRVLQEREVQPLGATRVEKIDVRLVSSTHRDLHAEVKAGRFREDLYYRVAVVELVVPPLRERPGDVPLLAREFARKYSERFGLQEVAELSPELVERLAAAPWPCNVRQLVNTIARCVALATSKIIDLNALVSVGNAAPPAGHDVSQGAVSGVTPDPAGPAPSYREQLDAFERNLLGGALAACGGNQSGAARRLGLSRATLYDRLVRHGLLPEGGPRKDGSDLG